MMDDQDTNGTVDDPITTSQASFGFSYKTIWNHFAGILSRPLPLITLASACFGGLWTIFEASVNPLNVQPHRPIAYLSILGLALVFSCVMRIWAYINTCPEGLESVSPAARRIAHLQRTKWEFRFAKSVLASHPLSCKS